VLIEIIEHHIIPVARQDLLRILEEERRVVRTFKMGGVEGLLLRRQKL
jgi:hypothetical protein